METPVPDDYRTKSGHEMRVRNNTSKLEELHKVFRERILDSTRVHLIYSSSMTPPLSNTFILNHSLLAQRLANFVMPSVTLGSSLNAYQVAPMNEILDVVSEELGLMVGIRPTMSIQEKFSAVIQDYSHLTTIIEGMLEHFLKNTGYEAEGHDIQAMYVAKQYLDGIEKQPLTDHMINIAVFVPTLSPDLIASYAKYFSKHLVTVSSDTSSAAQVSLSTDEDLIGYLNDTITRPVSKLANKSKAKK